MNSPRSWKSPLGKPILKADGSVAEDPENQPKDRSECREPARDARTGGHRTAWAWLRASFAA